MSPATCVSRKEAENIIGIPFCAKAARLTERTMEERMRVGGSRGGKVCLFCPPNTRMGNWGGSQRCESVLVIGGRGRCAPHGAEGNLFSLGDRACCHGAPRPIGGSVVQWGGGFIIENFLSLSRTRNIA